MVCIGSDYLSARGRMGIGSAGMRPSPLRGRWISLLAFEVLRVRVLMSRQYETQRVAYRAAGSDLARAADVLIPFQANEEGNIYKPTSSRFALLAILDMIATATAEARGPKVLESLRRIKHSLNTLTI